MYTKGVKKNSHGKSTAILFRFIWGLDTFYCLGISSVFFPISRCKYGGEYRSVNKELYHSLLIL